MKRAAFVLLSIPLIAAVSLVVPTACETPIASSYLLTQPRILAIRSSPPDVPVTGDVTLDALVYTPAGSAAPTYQWSWCASVNATLGCATTADALTSLLDPDGASGLTITYSLGNDAQATFSLPATAAVIQAACDRRRAMLTADAGDASADGGDASDTTTADSDASATSGGAPGLTCDSDSLTVDILLTVDVGGTKLQAIRTIALDFSAPEFANTNPTIDGVAPYSSASSIPDAGGLANPLAAPDGSLADASVGRTSGGVITLAADVPTSATDLYAPTGMDRNPMGAGASDAASACLVPADGGACVTVANATYESLSIAWYVESGQLGAETTTMPATTFGNPQDWSAALLNTWTPPSGGGTSQMILVVRDDRGGVGWIRQTVSP